MSVSLGLKFDLSLLAKGAKDAGAMMRRSMVGALKPFDQAMRRTAGGIHKAFVAPLGKLGSAISSVKGLVVGLLGAMAARAIVGAVRDFAKAALDLADAKQSVDNAMRGAGVKGGASALDQTATDISRGYGKNRGEVFNTGADMIGRGFGIEQTKQILGLAAAASQRNGQTMQANARLMANALNGNVKAAQKLGIAVAVTGDKVRDSAAVAEKLKATFGGIAGNLDNSAFENLPATWERVRETIGAAILPMVERFASKINAVLSAIEGGALQEAITWVSDKVQAFVGIVGRISSVVVALFNYASAWFGEKVSMLLNGAPGVLQTLAGLVLQYVDEVLRKLPGGAMLAYKLGLKSVGEGLKEQGATNLQFAKAAGMKTDAALYGALGDALTGKGGAANDLGAWFDRKVSEGEAMRKAAQERVAKDTMNGQSLTPANLAAQEAAKAEKARQAGLAKLGERNYKARADAAEGKQIRLSVVSARPDRFRKARLA